MQSKEQRMSYESFIENEVFIKHYIYCDINIIKDLSIGTIVSKIDKTDYYQLLDFLSTSKYKNRISDDLNIAVTDKKVSDTDILATSPLTNYYNFLLNLITNIKNNKSNSNNNLPTELVINFFPLDIDIKLRTIITNYLQEKLGIKVTSIINPINITILDKYDCLLIYNFNNISKLIDDEFTEDELYYSKILRRYENVTIFTPKLIHVELDKSDDEITKDFEFCENYMKLLFDFHYMEASIPYR
jgi:hypothetical protein